jgi:hypothetical protein
MWYSFGFLVFLVSTAADDLSAKAAITLPRVVKERLMLAPSFNLVPVAPVLSARSLPARSTKLMRLTFSVMTFVVSSTFLDVKKMVNTA